MAMASSAADGAVVPWSTLASLAAVWMLGVLAMLTRFAIGTARVATLARTSQRVDDGRWLALVQRTATRLGLVRPVTLLRGDRLAVPVTWGVVYPVVLLPEEAVDWPEERREFVLVHEMAHVKRFDALTQVVSQLAEAILWFSPFVWYAAQRARVEREHACDDYVLRQGTRPSFYADELLGMVRRFSAGREAAVPAFAALAMARRSEFEGRMLAILDPSTDRAGLGSRGSLATVAAALVLTIPLAAVNPFGARMEAAVVERGIVSVPRTGRGAATLLASSPTVPAGPAAGSGQILTRDAARRSPDGLPNRVAPPGVPGSPVLQRADRPTLLALMIRIGEMGSDGDKSALLIQAAPRYMSSDDSLRAAFFRALGTVASSSDRTNVILAVMPIARITCDEAMLETIEATRGIDSDGDRATALLRIIRGGLLVSARHRDAFAQAARTISSDGDYRTVMSAFLKS